MPIKGRAEFNEKLKRNADTFVQGLAYRALVRLQETTPERLGRARANWNVGLGAPDTSTKWQARTGDIEPAKARGATKLSDFTVGMKAYITNALFYVKILNDGNSKQAPRGMVQIVAAEMKQEAAQAARAIRTTAGGITVPKPIGRSRRGK